MNVISRFLQWLTRGKRRRHGQPPGVPNIEEILESGFRRFREIDPETGTQWRRLDAALEQERFTVHTRRPVARIPLLKPAISFAAVIVILVVVGILWLPRTSTMKYETAKGQHNTITLSDSTVVTLNHTSELTVNHRPFERARRVVLKGEAFFDVPADGTPFIITTDVGTVQVLGTEFNVLVRDDRLEVAVLRGRVRVHVDINGKDSAVVLGAGQIATCTGGMFPGSPEAILFSEYPGWMHGKFMFYRRDLVSACKEIESQFDVKIRMESLPNETMTGVVDGRNAETALATLAKLTGKKYRHENSTYILY